MKTKNLTDAQMTALRVLSTKTQMSTGSASNGLRFYGVSGSAMQALVRRGLATSEYNALFETTYYEITNAGRALLAAQTAR